DLDHMPDIDHQQERRVSMLYGEGTRIVLCLLASGQHHLIPAARSALGLTGFSLQGVLGDQERLTCVDLRALPFSRLLGFEDEAAATIAVDTTRRARAVGVLEIHTPLEHIVVQFVLLLRHVRAVKAESLTKADDKQLIVRKLGSAGLQPGSYQSVQFVDIDVRFPHPAQPSAIPAQVETGFVCGIA
ncbi:MAG: hypothetical protein M9944_13875, partial [Rhizobiaceae bacterium]|nr:hypothetical protein [Rhizobiaceae bacterium]